MKMKIAIISDSHDNWANLEKAVQIANEKECEVLLFAGDLVSPPGIETLEKFNGNVEFIWGNNEGEKMGMTRRFDASKKITLHGNEYEGEIDSLKIFISHYPRIAELAAKSKEFDLVIHGHNHTARNEKVGDTILLNPGEVYGGKGPASFAIFDTKTKEIEEVTL